MELQPRQSGDLRGLKALVAMLGVLVVCGTALVIGIVIQRIYAKPQATSMVSAPAIAARVPTPLVLAKGERIDGIAGAGSAVAVWVSGPAGDRLLLVNPATGEVAVALAPAS